MYDESISIQNEVPAPLVIRWIKPLYRMWWNPVVQRHVWHLLKSRDYEKYTKKPGEFKREMDFLFSKGIFLGAGLCVAFTAFSYLVKYIEYLYQRIGPVNLIIGYVVLLALGIIRWRFFPPKKKPKVENPVGQPVPPAIFLHDMFQTERMDPVLTVPMSERELFAAEIIGSYAISICVGAGSCTGFIGYVLACLAESFIFRFFGQTFGSFVNADPVGQFIMAFVLFPGLAILITMGHFMQTCLGIRMPYISATIASIILCLIIAVWFLQAVVIYYIRNFSNISFANTALPAVIFIVAVIAMDILIVMGFYHYGLRTFSALRRRRD